MTLQQTRRSRARRRAAGAVALRLFVLLVAVSLPGLAQPGPSLFTYPVNFCGKGGIETVVWLEAFGPRLDSATLVMMELAVGLSDRLDLGIAGGIGLEPGRSLTGSGPSVFAAYLFREPADPGFPGLALAAGLALPLGQGAAGFEEPGLWLIVPVTFSFRGGGILLHLNLGLAGAPRSAPDVRPFWGVAVDAATPVKDLRALVEVFAGDPFEPTGPSLGGQLGLYWIVTESLWLDLGLAALADPSGLGEPEFVARLGMSFFADWP